jgi:hypothetical protein
VCVSTLSVPDAVMLPDQQLRNSTAAPAGDTTNIALFPTRGSGARSTEFGKCTSTRTCAVRSRGGSSSSYASSTRPTTNEVNQQQRSATCQRPTKHKPGSRPGSYLCCCSGNNPCPARARLPVEDVLQHHVDNKSHHRSESENKHCSTTTTSRARRKGEARHRPSPFDACFSLIHGVSAAHRANICSLPEIHPGTNT